MTDKKNTILTANLLMGKIAENHPIESSIARI
jgi:hypothetical protein